MTHNLVHLILSVVLSKLPLDFSRVESLVEQNLGVAFPTAQIQVRVRGEIVHARAFGYLDPETQTQATNAATRFDLASVSKLFTTAAFMALVEEGHAALDQRVSEIFPEFSGTREIAPYPDPLHPGELIEVAPAVGERANASPVTFRHLLAHNSGLPAWLPLWKMDSREQMRDAVFSTAFAYPTGTRVVYSDLGLILLGWAIEKIAGAPLDAVVRGRVTVPLALPTVSYGPIGCANVAPTEFYTHQRRRMCGEVHDENAWALGGVAGHAGLFATAHDVAAFGEMFWRGGAPLLKQQTVAEMTRMQAQDGAVRRGVGFLLWSPDPNASNYPLSERAYGHLGFTGTSLWIDPARELVCACLTNRVYYGRGGPDYMTPFRRALNRTLVEILDAG